MRAAKGKDRCPIVDGNGAGPYVSLGRWRCRESNGEGEKDERRKSKPHPVDFD